MENASSTKMEEVETVLETVNNEHSEVYGNVILNTEHIQVYEMKGGESQYSNFREYEVYLEEEPNPSEECQQCLNCELVFSSRDLSRKHKCSENTKHGYRALHSVMTQTEDPNIIVNESTRLDNKMLLSQSKKLPKQLFQCQDCSKSFESISKLERHRLRHTGEKPFKCRVCDKGFTQFAHLKVHMELHTGPPPGSKIIHCDVCSKQFRSVSAANRHLLSHSKVKLFMCSQCNKGFNLPSHLKRHELIHTGVKPYSCDDCNKSFTAKSSLMVHMMQHTGTRPFKCLLCEKAFYDQSHLTRHQKVHARKRASYSKKKSYLTRKTVQKETVLKNDGNLKKEIIDKSTMNETNMCDQCGKVYPTRSNLQRHMIFHTGESAYRFSCHLCKKSFQEKFHLISHQQKHRTSRLHEICKRSRNFYDLLQFSSNQYASDSGESYSSEKSLNMSDKTSIPEQYKEPSTLQGADKTSYEDSSIKMVSPSNVKNKCPICGKGFAHPSNLLKHKKTVHSSIRAYECAICQKTFTQNAHLKGHLKKIHGNNGSLTGRQTPAHQKDKAPSTRYQCSVCTELFDHILDFNSHLSEHTSFTIIKSEPPNDYVGQTMDDASSSGQKCVVESLCSICLKQFKDETALLEHKQLEHDHACDICEMKFVNNTDLLDHVKQMHANQDALNDIDLSAQLDGHNPVPIYKCAFCDQHFQNVQILNTHVASHQNVPKSSYITSTNRGEVIGRLPSTPVKNQCGRCGKGFAHPSNLLKHTKTVHAAIRAFKCEICDRKFTQNAHLKGHMKNIHQKAKGMDNAESELYECDTCSAIFQNVLDLNQHIKTHKTTNEDFSLKNQPVLDTINAEIDDKLQAIVTEGGKIVLRDSNSLTNCELADENACIPCGRKFGKQSDMMLHLKHVHKSLLVYDEDENVVKPDEKEVANPVTTLYECGVCARQFNVQEDIVAHIEQDHNE